MASLAAIVRQIKREGARWGLVPRLVREENKVQVCEMVIEMAPGVGGVVSTIKVPRVVCSLTEDSPMDAWSAVLMHRLKREHHDFMRMVNARRARLRKEAEKEVAERGRDLRKRLEALARRRVISTGIPR